MLRKSLEGMTEKLFIDEGFDRFIHHQNTVLRCSLQCLPCQVRLTHSWVKVSASVSVDTALRLVSRCE